MKRLNYKTCSQHIRLSYSATSWSCMTRDRKSVRQKLYITRGLFQKPSEGFDVRIVAEHAVHHQRGLLKCVCPFSSQEVIQLKLNDAVMYFLHHLGNRVITTQYFVLKIMSDVCHANALIYLQAFGSLRYRFDTSRSSCALEVCVFGSACSRRRRTDHENKGEGSHDDDDALGYATVGDKNPKYPL